MNSKLDVGTKMASQRFQWEVNEEVAEIFFWTIVPIFSDGGVLNCCQKKTIVIPALCSFPCLAQAVPLAQLNTELIQLRKSSVNLHSLPPDTLEGEKGRNLFTLLSLYLLSV